MNGMIEQISLNEGLLFDRYLDYAQGPPRCVPRHPLHGGVHAGRGGRPVLNPTTRMTPFFTQHRNPLRHYGGPEMRGYFGFSKPGNYRFLNMWATTRRLRSGTTGGLPLRGGAMRYWENRVGAFFCRT